MARGRAAATDPGAEEAAQLALTDGATALGAALSGFFSAAGRLPGVLFGPVSLLVGGLGAGVFAYDGRPRQPGKEAKRPRGFEEGDAIPLAARVAIPGSIFAAAVACAFHPGTSFLASARRGVSAAKHAGFPNRAAFLEIVASQGATALSHAQVQKAFLTQFGVVEGGLVTRSDLVASAGIQVRAQVVDGGWCSPWSDESSLDCVEKTHAIVAGDVQGVFAALSYSELRQGALLEPYDVNVPLAAVPVRRGLSRVTPGTPLGHGDGLKIEESLGEVRGVSAATGESFLQLLREGSSRELRSVIRAASRA
jgi:hypothetical protein